MLVAVTVAVPLLIVLAVPCTEIVSPTVMAETVLATPALVTVVALVFVIVYVTVVGIGDVVAPTTGLLNFLTVIVKVLPSLVKTVPTILGRIIPARIPPPIPRVQADTGGVVTVAPTVAPTVSANNGNAKPIAATVAKARAPEMYFFVFILFLKINC
jgi:hypothetical protein